MSKPNIAEPDRIGADTITLDNDYQSELPRGSRSANAAKLAEGDVEIARGQRSQFRLPPIGIDGAHARDMQQRFSAAAYAYDLGHKGHGTAAAAYKNLTARASGYGRDAATLDAAGVAYNQLVPQASFALDSVVRFKTIQAELGPAYADHDEWTETRDHLAGQVSDRRPEVADAMGPIKGSKGLVSGEAAGFRTAQYGIYAAMAALRQVANHQLVVGLQAKLGEAKDQREAIEESIESASSLSEWIGAKLGFAQDVAVGPTKMGEHEHVARTEGRFETAAAVDEAAGVVLGGIMYMLHDGELAKVDTEINSIHGALKTAEMGAELAALDNAHRSWTHAKMAYIAARDGYANALASRRTQYAMAGKAADRAHEKGPLNHGNDKASQAMLYISAGREAAVVLRTSLTAGKEAEDTLHEALVSCRHRSTPFLVDDWQSGTPEGSSAPDQQAALTAYGLTTTWVAATEKEAAAFAEVEQASASMLRTSARAVGDY